MAWRLATMRSRTVAACAASRVKNSSIVRRAFARVMVSTVAAAVALVQSTSTI